MKIRPNQFYVLLIEKGSVLSKSHTHVLIHGHIIKLNQFQNQQNDFIINVYIGY